MILGEEALLEEQKLMFGAGGVVDDTDKKAFEVDLDAGEQLGKWCRVKVPVVVKRELPRMEVDFDEIRIARIAIEPGGALDIDAENSQSMKRRDREAGKSWRSAVSRKTK